MKGRREGEGRTGKGEEEREGGEGRGRETQAAGTHEYLTAALIFMPPKLVSRSLADKGTTSISTSFCKAGHFVEEFIARPRL